MSGPAKPLSERERQLIEFASNGLTDSAIAGELGISEATVATYWGRIRMKYGPLSRPELIAQTVRLEFESEVKSLKDENKALLAALVQGSAKGTKTEADFFRQALDAAGDAILVVNEDGVMEWVNGEASRVFGFKKSELEGQHLSLLVPARYRKAHKIHMAEYTRKPTRRRMSEHSTTYAVTKSGKEIAIAATLSPMVAKGRTLVVCVVRPLSKIAAKRLKGE